MTGTVVRPGSWRSHVRRLHAGQRIGSLVLVALAGCGGSPSAPAEVPDVEPVVHDGAKVKIPDGSPLRGRLKTEPARTRAISETLQVPAQVETDPTTTAKITPPVAGRVVTLFVHVGDTVKQGQPLFTLDAPDLVTAQSDYLRAQSMVAQAEKTLARQKDLKDHGVGSEKDLEQAQTTDAVMLQ